MNIIKGRHITKAIVVLIFGIIVVSCSGEWHLRKAEWKAPELFVPDTLTIYDTTVFNSITISDTLTLHHLDTAVVRDSVVYLRLVRHVDTIHYKVACEPDTIIKEIRIPVEIIKPAEIIEKEVKASPWMFIAGVFSTVILFIIGLNISRR